MQPKIPVINPLYSSMPIEKKNPNIFFKEKNKLDVHRDVKKWVIIFEYKYHAAIVWKTNWTSALAKKDGLKVVSQDWFKYKR